MSDFVFGLVMYGIPDPRVATSSTVPCLYTDGFINASDAGLPSELTGCTMYRIVTGKPGQNWGADPRNPTGQNETITVLLEEDQAGTLSQLFLYDDGSVLWGFKESTLTDVDSLASIVGSPEPTDDVPYFLGRECVTVVANSSPTPFYRSLDIGLTRARCGSLSQTHCLRPSDYSNVEDGTDRLYLREKPDWDAGFYCGLYLFKLDQFGAISDYILRRGRVVGAPQRRDGNTYAIEIEYLEDALNAHEVGGTSKEISLSHMIVVTKIEQQRPQEVSFLLTKDQAEAFFNEPVSRRGSKTIDSATLTDLEARLQSDTETEWQIKLSHGDDWIFKINALSFYQWNSEGAQYKTVKVDCSLVDDGYFPDTNIQIAATASGQQSQLKPWYLNAIPQGNVGSISLSGTTEGEPPKLTLRVKLTKTVVQAFLTLATSVNGQDAGAYDTLIGGFGAGIPLAYFNLGAVQANPLNVSGTTTELLELDQLLDDVNTYYFDLSKGISLRDFLTNEFIATQVFLGSLQSGLLTIKLWNHAEASALTIASDNDPSQPPIDQGQQLSAIKRLDLSAGVRVIDLEPQQKRLVRFSKTSPVKKEQVQEVRFWRNVNLSVGADSGITPLIEAFYRQFGGQPLVFTVPISLETFMASSVEFGDRVSWSNDDILTPTGRGINGIFFVIGIDISFDTGILQLKLLQDRSPLAYFETLDNTQFAPTIKIDAISVISSTVIDLTVSRLDGATFDPSTDFSGVFSAIQSEGSFVQVENFDHAPLGTQEETGSIESFGVLTTITAGPPVVFRLTLDSDFLRGSAATIDDLFVVGETRLSLPRRVSEEELSATLIEPVDTVSTGRFATFTQARPLGAQRYKFGV